MNIYAILYFCKVNLKSGVIPRIKYDKKYCILNISHTF